MKRVFSVGERIYDNHDKNWGTIVYLCGPTYTRKQDLLDEDCIIGYVTDEFSNSTNETLVKDAYQIAQGRLFQGEFVCWEHNDIDYPFYCPVREENVYHAELD